MLEKDQNDLTTLEHLLLGIASVLCEVHGIEETENAFKSLADDPRFWEVRKTINSMDDRELLESLLKEEPVKASLRLIENKENKEQ